MPTNLPDLSLLNGIVSPVILEAMAKASKQLMKAGVRHLLVGGLAVGAYGYPRASKDVDFLVGDEAFEFHEGGIVTIAPGVPIMVDGIAVDEIGLSKEDRSLDGEFDRGTVSNGIPVASIEVLVYLKLKSPRRKDSVDIIELLKAGVIDVEAMRRYLNVETRRALIMKFENLVESE